MKISPAIVRFLLEAAFLVLVAAAAGIARLSALAIVLVMAIAWTLTALVERTASQSGRPRPGPLGFFLPGPTEPDAAPEGGPETAATVETQAEAEPAEKRRRRLPLPGWPARPDLEEEGEAQAISHVTVLPGEPRETAEAWGDPPAPAPVPTDGAPVPEPAPSAPPVEPGLPASAAADEEPPPASPPAPPIVVTPAPVEEALAQPPPPQVSAPAPLEVAPAPPPPPAPAPASPPPERVVPLRPRNGPREWNLWDLERMARAGEGADAARDEERALMLMHLRQFADADGVLPVTFDPLVRESFGELISRP